MVMSGRHQDGLAVLSALLIVRETDPKIGWLLKNKNKGGDSVESPPLNFALDIDIYCVYCIIILRTFTNC